MRPAGSLGACAYEERWRGDLSGLVTKAGAPTSLRTEGDLRQPAIIPAPWVPALTGEAASGLSRELRARSDGLKLKNARRDSVALQIQDPVCARIALIRQYIS